MVGGEGKVHRSGWWMSSRMKETSGSATGLCFEIQVL